MRCQAKNIAKNVWKAEREAAGGHSSKKLGADVPTKRRYVKKKDREDKTGASGSGTTAGSNPSGQARSTTVAVESAAANSVQMITTSATLLDGSLATTTSSSTTPIVANSKLL